MLPIGEQLLNKSFQTKSDQGIRSSPDGEENGDNVMIAGSHLIVLQFLKSGFVNNPVIVS